MKRLAHSTLPFVLIFFFIVLIIYLILYFSNYFDTVRDNLQNITSKEVAGKTLVIGYPARVLYDAPPQEIRVTRLATTTSSDPLTLTVTLDEGFTLSEPTSVIKIVSILTNTETVTQPNIPVTALASVTGTATVSTSGITSISTIPPQVIMSYQFVFSTAQEVQALSFYVSNAQIIEDNALYTKVITIEMSDFSDPLSLPIEVEGAKRSVGRIFISSVLSENSSLIILLTALISFITFGISYRQQQNLEKKEAQTRFEEKVLGSLVQVNPHAAQQELSKMRTEGLHNFIDSTELEHAENLIQVGSGYVEESNLERIILEAAQIRATLGALTARAGNLLDDKERKSFQNTVNIFYSKRHISGEERQKLEDIISGWKKNAERVTKSEWRDDIDFEPQHLPTGSTIGERLRYSPFASETAEDDEGFLFKVNGFWYHPLYKKVINSKPEIIYGPEGCGKTALAYALVRRTQTKALPVYISGQPDITDVQYAIAYDLLKYICNYPFVLSTAGSTARNLLARQLLCSGLDYHIIQRKIQEAKSKYPTQDTDNEKAKVWQREDILQLDNFQATLEKYHQIGWMTTGAWLKLTQASLEAFSFKIAFICLDLNTEKMEHIREMVGLIRPWQDYHLVMKVFLSQSAANEVRKSSNAEFLPFIWTDEHIKDLVHQRIDKAIPQLYPDSRANAEELFDKDLFTRFIQQAKKNPRRLVRLWHHLFEFYHLKSSQNARFSAQNLNEAVRQLNRTG